MGALFTADRVLVVPDYWLGTVRSQILKNPLQALLKVGKTPTNTTQYTEVEPILKPSNPVMGEGEDNEDDPVSEEGDKLGHECEIVKSTKWQVTEEREQFPGFNDKTGANVIATAKARCLRKAVLSIENMLCSAQECVQGSKTVKGLTRGMAKWLDPAVKTSAYLPCPEAYLPLDPITGDVTTAAILTEEIFHDKLDESVAALGDGDMVLTGLVGSKLKRLMSTWLGKAPTQANVNDRIQVLRQATDKKISQIVDFFEYDNVVCRVATSNHLLADPTTMLTTKNSLYSGFFFFPEMWSIDWKKKFMPHAAGENKGGGERGFYKGCLRLHCGNPQGQFKIVDTATRT